MLINNGNVAFQVAKGDRIAQMIIEKILTQGLVPVTELPKTEQSKKGFGSMGSRNTTLQSIDIDEGNGANVQIHTTLYDEGNGALHMTLHDEGNGALHTTLHNEGNETTRYHDIYTIYHEIDEFSDEWINAKTSHLQVLYKKYQGQIEDKPQKSIEDLVPQELHEYLDVFLEEAASRFPERKLWDHKILLKKDFKPRKGKIYDLSPEDILLQEFIQENSKEGYIVPSESPMASSFFFVSKKGMKKK